MKRYRIVVTGGSGYLGVVVVQQLLECGYDVVSIDRVESPLSAQAFDDRLTIVLNNFFSAGALQRYLPECSAVIHLAGVSDGRQGRIDPQNTWKINADASKTLIDSAVEHGVSRFLFASTFGVYGNNYQVALTEDLPVDPAEPYSASKAEIEHYLIEKQSNAFNPVILRLAMIYGWSPAMRYDLLVNTLIKNAIVQKRLDIFGGDQRRPQIHVRDASTYFLKILQMSPQTRNKPIYNIVTENRSVRELAILIWESLDYNVHLNFLPGRSRENTFWMDNTKTAKEIQIEPIHSVLSAIPEIKTRLAA